jgi:MSHA biogenesis protein MshO
MTINMRRSNELLGCRSSQDRGIAVRVTQNICLAGKRPAIYLQRGFTLVEAIVVMVITGIIASIVGLFIVGPVEGYFDTASRAELTDVADTALRRIARDIRLALPNSVRVTTGADNNVYLELLLTRTGGRYLADEDNPTAGGRPLRFDTANCAVTPTDCQFTVVGGLPTGAQEIMIGDAIVVFNLGPGFAPADAYDCTSTCNRATVTAITTATDTVTLANNPFASQQPRMRSPSNRFQAVATAVTYVCVNGALKRYWRYPTQATQPTSTTAAPLSNATSAVLATGVSTCNFTSNVLATRFGSMVELQITMGSAAGRSGAIQLVHQVQVDNTP